MSQNKESIRFSRKDIKYIAMIIFSSLLYSFGMNSFVKFGNLFPGGFAGISRLLSLMLADFLHIHISFSVLYFALNILTTFIVWNRIGHKFVLYSGLWFTLTSLFTALIKIPDVTSDHLLIAVFGGLINGTAIGIALRANGSSGGTDFIAIDLSIRLNKPTWNYILGVNAVVLVIAGLVYGWNQALYSIIFQYVSTQVVNSIHQRYKVTTLQIVTNFPDDVCRAIFHTCRHGITRVPCEGAYSHEPHWLLLTSINTYQERDVIDIVKATDPHAFISVVNVDRVVGNYYQKPLE